MTRLSRGLELVGVARRARVGLLGLWIVAGAPLAAQSLRWGAIGPQSGGILSLATAAGGGGVVWAAAGAAGVLRSVDGGASWELTSLAQPQSYYAVVTDPADPLVVYAEGVGGLAKTTDGGATWKVINPTAAAAFAIAPSAPGTLYLASPGNIVSLAAVSRSDDGGATWRPLAELPPLVESLTELDIDPANLENVFAQGFSFHLDPVSLLSADGGQSWTFGGLPVGGNLFGLQIDPRAGVIYGLSRMGPQRSRDAGMTWKLANAGLPMDAVPVALALDRASGALYFSAGIKQNFMTLGQIWKSVDGGTTWGKLVERSGALNPLVLDGALPGRVYAGTEEVGLLASADAGQHWQVASAGFVAPTILSLVADAQAAGTLYASVRPQSSTFAVSSPVVRLEQSQDGGATWTSWVPVDPDGATVFLGFLVADPFGAGSLYSVYNSRLLHSADGGRTWRFTGDFPAGFAGGSVVVDPLHAGVLFAGGEVFEQGSAVLRSADGGQTWNPVLSVACCQSAVEIVFADPTPPEALFAAGRGSLWRSLDGGQTWVSRGAGLPVKEQLIFRMQTGPGHNLYAELTPAGPGLHALYRSTDRGDTWEPIDAGLPDGEQVNDLLAGPQATTLYIATSDGVFISEDGGGHWAAQNDGLPSTGVGQLLAGPARSGILYAATYYGGLAVSPPLATTCQASDEVLCLAGGRFAARIHWSLADGSGGEAHAAALTDRSGGFWFFSPESLDLTVKMIDGRSLNGNFWLFGGALTDVAYTLTVTEAATGHQRTYDNPFGRLASFADTEAFAVTAASRAGSSATEPSSSLPVTARLGAAATAGALCIPAADTLCSADSRFAVRVSWSLPGLANQSAGAVPLFGSTGAFWFFSPQLPELTVKVLDGRALNGHFWVYLGGLSGVAYTATVTDTATGASKHYAHPAGTVGSVADTSF
jgi:photosystem II stability/assembly factor-like uncharacterized protein